MQLVIGVAEAGKHCHLVELEGSESHYAYSVDSSDAIRLVRDKLGISGDSTLRAKVTVVDAPPQDVLDAIAEAEKSSADRAQQLEEESAAKLKAEADSAAEKLAAEKAAADAKE